MLVNLPRKYPEADAAKYLEVSESFLRQERRAGNIGFVKLGRKVYYLDRHLVEYLERQECPSSNDSKSESTGYQNKGVARIGAQRGLTALPDKQSAHRSALAILKKPSKG